MRVIRVLPGMGIRSNVGTMGAAAVTLIEQDNTKILVDVGHFGNRYQLLDSLNKLGLTPNDINYIVLTHINWDHCLNIDLFQKSIIILHENEYRYGTLSGSYDGFNQVL